MRPLLFPAVVAVATPLSAPPLAVDRNVTFINQTGHGIAFVGFNPPGDHEGTDHEISAVLDTNASAYVNFNRGDFGCPWRIRIDWVGGGEPVYVNDVDLCTIDD